MMDTETRVKACKREKFTFCTTQIHGVVSVEVCDPHMAGNTPVMYVIVNTSAGTQHKIALFARLGMSPEDAFSSEPAAEETL